MKLSIELVSRSILILDTLVDSGIAGGSLNIDSIQTSHIGLIQSNFVLKRVPFWTDQNALILDFRVIEFIRIMFATV